MGSNMKSPKFAWPENRNHTRKLSKNFIWKSMLCTNPMPKLRCGAVRDSNHIQLFAVKDTDTDTDLY